MNPFTWLRRRAAEAFALGVSDGLRAVCPEGEEPPTDLAGLRALVASSVDVKALPVAATDEEAPKRGRKG